MTTAARDKINDKLLLRHLGRLDFDDASDKAEERGWRVSVETGRTDRRLETIVEDLAITMVIPGLYGLQEKHPGLDLRPGPFVLVEGQRGDFQWVEVSKVREISEDLHVVNIRTLHEAAALALEIADGDREVLITEPSS